MATEADERPTRDVAMEAFDNAASLAASNVGTSAANQ
jgi:hypothetical protein